MKDQPTVAQSLCLSPGTAGLWTILNIPNLDCPSAEKLIRVRLADVENVASLTFDLRGRKLTVEHGRQEIAPILLALDENRYDGRGHRTRCEAESNLDKLSTVAGTHEQH